MCRISKSPTYLVRNPYSYCFRINVPQDLQPFIERREIRRSLKTGSLKVTKDRARWLACDFQHLFHHIRNLIAMQELSNAEIREHVNRYICELMDRFENLRIRPMSIQERKRKLEGLSRYTEIVRRQIPQVLRECDHECASRAFGEMIAELAPGIDKGSLNYRNLCREMTIAFQRLAGRWLEWSAPPSNTPTIAALQSITGFAHAGRATNRKHALEPFPPSLL